MASCHVKPVKKSSALETEANDRHLAKKTEQQVKLKLRHQQLKDEKLYKQKMKQKAEPRRKMVFHYDHGNTNILKKRREQAERRQREQEAEQKEAQHQYEDYVNEEVRRAVSDNRIVFPCQAEDEPKEAQNDRLYLFWQGKKELVPRSLEARKKKLLDQKHQKFNQEVVTAEGLYFCSGLSCDSVQKLGSTPESRKIKEKIEQQHIGFCHEDSEKCARNSSPKNLLSFQSSRAPTEPAYTMELKKTPEVLKEKLILPPIVSKPVPACNQAYFSKRYPEKDRLSLNRPPWVPAKVAPEAFSRPVIPFTPKVPKEKLILPTTVISSSQSYGPFKPCPPSKPRKNTATKRFSKYMMNNSILPSLPKTNDP